MTVVAKYWPLCEHCGRYMARGRLVSGSPEFCPEYEYDCACEKKSIRKPGRRPSDSGTFSSTSPSSEAKRLSGTGLEENHDHCNSAVPVVLLCQ